ncbi:MAG TPA: rhomboid family intramembrane serine protease [Candidatus Acidoferrales bacterium]|nr:rhomboid family intramembrane serine protease [Candidatus Acidoferrales bacterium]
MIPLRDRNPSSTRPVVNVALIVVNTAAFLYELTLPSRAEQAFFMLHALVPARVEYLLSGPHVSLQAAALPFLTSMFLHGGWLHLIGNMWFLWVFGDNVEDRLGHFSYLCFYLFCGFGSGLAHVMMNLGSNVPSLGASGAISGVLGAYIVLYPRAKVLTLMPLIVFWFTVELPAFVILGYWFLIQFFSGITSVGNSMGGGVAYWAHIGGFVIGVAMVKIWPSRPQRPRFFSPAY